MNTIRRQCGMSKNSENRAERDSSNVYWKVEGVRNFERKISRIERSEIRVTFNLRLKECEILSERKNRDPSDGVFGYVWLGCGWGVCWVCGACGVGCLWCCVGSWVVCVCWGVWGVCGPWGRESIARRLLSGYLCKSGHLPRLGSRHTKKSRLFVHQSTLIEEF